MLTKMVKNLCSGWEELTENRGALENRCAKKTKENIS